MSIEYNEDCMITLSSLFALAMEGLICIIMAMPVAIPLALLGGLVERINSWEEGRRLGFTVVSGPEGSPYEIHPRHLNGYFVPESYWRLWSDALLHQIHMRVFQHIKALSERSA